MSWGSETGSLGTSAEGSELFGNTGLGYWKFLEEVLKDQRPLRIWGSEIGSLGRSAERLEMFQNTGLGKWKFRKTCLRFRSV
jgi:hypothetical protein